MKTSATSLFRLLCVLLIFFLLSEGFLRIQEYKTDIQYEQLRRNRPQDVFAFFTYDPVLGWRNKPLQEGPFRTSESTSHVSINAKGLRGKEYPYERSEKKRILVLGDSFVWGYGVEAKDRFTERLESLLGGRVEIVNAGVPGYGLDQYLLLLQQEGKKYKPDLVICAVNTVDLFDIFQRVNHGYPKPYFTIKKGNLSPQNVPVPRRVSAGEKSKRFFVPHAFVEVTPYPETNPFLQFLENHTLTYSLLKRELGGNRESRERKELVILLFKALRDTSREMKADLAILLIPLSEDVRFKHNSPLYRYLADFLTKSGYSIVDPHERLISLSQKEELYFLKSDKHWTPAGHRAIAELLYDFITQKGLDR